MNFLVFSPECLRRDDTRGDHDFLFEKQFSVFESNLLQEL